LYLHCSVLGALSSLLKTICVVNIWDAQMEDINRCRIYIQVLYTSDITDLAGNTIEEWAKQGKRQSNRKSKWNWPVKQRPPARAWKNWEIALQGIASEDGDLYSSLGSWKEKAHTHQTTKWNIDATTLSLFRHHEGVWTKHRAINYGRLRFELTGTATEEPRCITHEAEGVQRRRQIDLTEVHAVAEGAPEGGNDPAESIYTSEIGEC
jgi:hypothetical protein